MDEERHKQVQHFEKDYFDEMLDGFANMETTARRKNSKTGCEHCQKLLEPRHLKELERLVTAYLDLAENRAERNMVMNMKDWAYFLDKFLTLSDYPILKNRRKVSALKAKLKVEEEYEKY